MYSNGFSSPDRRFIPLSIFSKIRLNILGISSVPSLNNHQTDDKFINFLFLSTHRNRIVPDAVTCFINDRIRQIFLIISKDPVSDNAFHRSRGWNAWKLEN